jgi:hypothetical protein
MGAGPMTGRGLGPCAGYGHPGYANPAPGYGMGYGMRGGGRGWRNMYYATGVPGWARPGFVPLAPDPDQELAALKEQAAWLAGQAAAIQSRIEAIEGGPAPAQE